MTSIKRYQAFGEWKTIREWAQDDRCIVKETTLRNRMRDGWPMEQALTAVRHTKKRTKSVKHCQNIFEAVVAHSHDNTVENDWEPTELPSEPSRVRPGSEKLAVFRRRLEQGVSLWHPLDGYEDE